MLARMFLKITLNPLPSLLFAVCTTLLECLTYAWHSEHVQHFYSLLSTFAHFLNCLSHHHHLLCHQLLIYKQEKAFNPNSLCETSFSFGLFVSSPHLSVIALFPAIRPSVALRSAFVSLSVQFMLPLMVGCQP